MSQEWDSRSALWAYQNASQVVGTLGTSATSVATYLKARQVLKESPCSPGKKYACISSQMMEQLGENITTYFQPSDEIIRNFKEGSIGRLAGADFFESNSLYSHTAGTWASTVTVTGAGQSGSSLIITGTTGDTIKKGDKFSIANTNRVNRMTRRVAGVATARIFTSQQDFTLTAGPDTINMLPAIYGPGSQYQNVDALPVNGVREP